MLKRHFLITLEVTSKDRAYPWVLKWLAAQGKRTQHLSVETSLAPTRVFGSTNKRSVFSLIPGPGQHFLLFQGKFISVQRFREQQMMDLNTGKPWEKVQFMAIGSDTASLEAILAESYQMATHQEEGKTIIYTNWGSEWRQFGNPRSRRPLNSVILDDGVSERILADILEWQTSATWYADRGIPYRRGYLLHGPPGSGKSSFIFALAGHLGYNICVLNLAEKGLTDERLALALSCVPSNSIVLLEDVDAAFPARSARRQNDTKRALKIMQNSGSASSDVTFSGLLNVLDGVASSEERLIFMTTNFIENLDSALIRPGRVDIVELIGNATQSQIINMFIKFFPETVDLKSKTSSVAEQFASSIAESGHFISMAMLQGYFLKNKLDHKKAVSNLSIFLRDEIKKREVSSQEKEDDVSVHALDELEELKRHARASRGPLTVDEVDKMVFNPQNDWDKDITFFTGGKS
jgi:chaperone BCS1